MVIRDTTGLLSRTTKPLAGENHPNKKSLASPFDRLAAVIIDHIIILGPLQILLMAPFEKMFTESRVMGDEAAGIIAIVVIAGLFFLSSIFYHGFFVFLVGRSPGQMTLGLKVMHFWDGRGLSFTNAVFRTITWLVLGLMCGLLISSPFLLASQQVFIFVFILSFMFPNLFIFMDPWRRGLHDRITDTMVITNESSRIAAPPSAHELKIVRGFFLSGVVMTLLFLVTIAYGILREQSLKQKIISNLETEGSLCASISQAQEGWLEDNPELIDRLQIALSLYMSDVVDVGCLEAEFDPRVYDGKTTPMTYLAKAFVYADSAELSELYLEEICNLDDKSEECIIAKSQRLMEEQNYTEAKNLLAPLISSKNLYVNIWTAKTLVDAGSYQMAKPIIEKLPNYSEFSVLKAKLYTKVLQGLNLNIAAETSLRVSLPILNSEDKLNLASWVCYDSLFNSCRAVGELGCAEFNKGLNVNEGALESVQVALSYLKYRECNEGSAVIYKAILTPDLEDEVRELILAVAAENPEALKKIILNDSYASEIRLDAVSRFMDMSPKSDDLDWVVALWKIKAIADPGYRIGFKIINKWVERGEFEEAISIADILKKETEQSKILENILVRSYKSGEIKFAKFLFDKYRSEITQGTSTSQTAARSPASNQELIDIIRSLK